MKPFLILQLRPEDEASDNEFEAFLKFGNLSKDEVERIRIEKEGVPKINLENYSGVIVGGGPYNVSDDNKKKSKSQLKAEAGLNVLLKDIVKKDFPYLGACYGLGIISCNQGGSVSKEKYGEDVGAVSIRLSEEGKRDELLKDVPNEFRAFVGHKEACQDVPKGAVLLASSTECPVQMIRFGKNVYATQFHPELDSDGIEVRVNVYKNYGYFPPEEGMKIIKNAQKENVFVPMSILKKFVEKYKR